MTAPLLVVVDKFRADSCWAGFAYLYLEREYGEEFREVARVGRRMLKECSKRVEKDLSS